MTAVVIGVDPGIVGAIAVMRDGQLVAVEDMPTMQVVVGGKPRRRVSIDGIDGLLRSLTLQFVGPLDEVVVVLEEVASTPGDGSVGAFAFGRGFGSLEGAIVGQRLPRVYVKPAAWKRALKLNKSKDASRQRACEHYPHLREKFARVKDDGRAEAALIAQWYIHHGSR